MTIKSIRTGWTGISALAGNPVIGDFESIQTVTVGSGGQANVEFTNIPSSYQHLQIRYIARFAGSGGFGNLHLRINGDTGSNYAHHIMRGNGTDTAAGGGSSQAHIVAGVISGATSFACGVVDLLDYASTNKTKVIRTLTGYENNGTDGYIAVCSGFRNNTAAVTSLTFYDAASANLAQYSHFALYGIR